MKHNSLLLKSLTLVEFFEISGGDSNSRYGEKKLIPRNKIRKPITTITVIKLEGSFITSGNTLIK